ncbi:hypothetical protein Y032_0036g3329 [Ancylostoma ceylanicum]|uniref:Uncharacterized protein n=4 Tax=Ancylostoma ceylanicum TaxID=53326 RepID=A0A016ULK1_9BILA|nr:hypothetical protein Y032_0036g3329 [Ancylostoma ceylanicum]
MPEYMAMIFILLTMANIETSVHNGMRIEEFLDNDAHIIFYDRFYNFEVMSGSYLVKNSDWSRDFLHGFANYEYRLPNSLHGSDNGALHAYLAELVLPPTNTELPICLRAYNESKGFGDLFSFEACIRKALGYGSSFGNIKILRKGTGWARDPRMTNSKWSKERDFMIHNWKKTSQKKYSSTPIPLEASPSADWFDWYNPILGYFELDLCTSRNTSWNYDENLMESYEAIEERLKEYEQEVEKMRAELLIHLKRLSDSWRNGRRNKHMTITQLNESWYAYAI